MTFNTGNQIGSTDARDLADNAENFDYLENSTTELTHLDRLGNVRRTRHGMEVEHDAQIAAHESEHDAQMQSFESDFDSRLAGMAFTRVGSFATGATLTDMRQVLIWEVSQGGDGHEYGWAGTFPKVVATGATPTTSGGIGAGAWVDRTDVTLRSDLESTSGSFSVTNSGYSKYIILKNLSFKTGATLGGNTQCLLNQTDGYYYVYTGVFPYVVAAGSTPTSLFACVGKCPTLNNDCLYVSAYIDDYTVDNTVAFKLLANAAKLLDKNIVGESGKLVKLTGNSVISIYQSLNMNNGGFDVSAFSGQLKFARCKTPVVYDSLSGVVTKLKTQATLSGNYFSGWLDEPLVDDSYIVLETNAPYYMYRLDTINRKEYIRHNRYGVVDAALIHPLTSSSVTQLTVYPIEDRYTTAENIIFNIGSNDNIDTLIKIETSLFNGINWRFKQDNALLTASNPYFINIVNSCHINLDKITFSFNNRTTSETGYTYLFRIDDSYDITAKNMRGDGDGWGATASNCSQRITFEHCKLSRIDFHQPFREFLNILNCDIGAWGVRITAIGDLNIVGGSITIDEMPFYNNTTAGFISSREDCGGFCDGIVTITGTKFINNSTTMLRILKHNATPGNVKPAGSPIKFNFWNSINLENISYAGYDRVHLLPAISGDKVIGYPSSITINNCKSGRFVILETGFNKINPPTAMEGTAYNPVSNTNNVRIYVTNSRISTYIALIDSSATQAFNIGLFCTNVTGDTYGVIPSVDLAFGGLANFTGCEVESFNFAGLNKKLKCTYTGGLIRHTSAISSMVIFAAHNPAYVDLTVSDSIVYASTQSLINSLAVALLNNVVAYVGTSTTPSEIIIATGFDTTLAQTMTVTPDTRNSCVIVSGLDGDGTQQLSPFIIPTYGRTHYVFITNTKYITIARSGSVLTAANFGSALARRIIIK